MAGIDPEILLAFNMQAQPGIYALLLGSGLSRSAGILTGWDIVVDLVRRVAEAMGEDPGADLARWYEHRFGLPPTYSELLSRLGATPAERRGILRQYFEPTEEQRASGQKVPQAAHDAIARLVSAGFIRVIITTNFDRLIEEALQTRGIQPVVISSPDGAAGAPPLQHSSCTVIKVHGDYQDARILNTAGELERYDRRLDRLLDRILDEYGLVVSGWSGEWDTALRAALERCPSRRFSTFWTFRTELGEAAERLVALRGAQGVRIAGADEFFEALAIRIEALEAVNRPHPASTKAAVEMVKAFLPDEGRRIKLHDLVMGEVERVCQQLEDTYPDFGSRLDEAEVVRIATRVDGTLETLKALFAVGCYWSEARHWQLWVQVLDRISNVMSEDRHSGTFFNEWLAFRLYPALTVLYAGGLAALARGDYGLLAQLLTKVRVRERGSSTPAAALLVTWHILAGESAEPLRSPPKRYNTPLSDHLHDILWPTLRQLIPDARGYETIFDQFEYLLGLVCADMRDKAGLGPRGPVGRFGWRDKELLRRVGVEVERLGDSWPPLQAGLFDGSHDRAVAVKAAYDRDVNESTARWW